VIGYPIHIPRKLSKSTLELYRQRLSDALNEVTREADNLMAGAE